MTILLEVIVGPDPADAATARSAGHIPPSYLPFLKKDGLKTSRLGVLRQVFLPQMTDARIIAHCAQTIAELTAAGAEIVAPLLVPELETIPHPPQTSSQFQTALTTWLSYHLGIPVSFPPGHRGLQAAPPIAPAERRRSGGRAAY
jgi:Asp-tRNA(Asn)/Glu-tRNA(Gln) amidotransferase A subunit family amidase